VFSILERLEDLGSVKSEDLLEVSLLLSDLSFIETNIILNADHNSDLADFKSLFIEEKKSSGEEYSDDEYKVFPYDIDEISTLIKLELESRTEGINHDERNYYGDLQDERLVK
jgi:hypothetical protein